MRILITAGPTREPIDAVRFISNRSSGKLGIALAEAAARAGHDVTLLLGTSSVSPPTEVHLHRFETTSQLQQLLEVHFADHDVLIMAAAVSDFRPVRTEEGKLRRADHTVELRMESMPDLCAETAKRKQPDQRVIAFALEEEQHLEQRAAAKLHRKGVDAIVANCLQTMDADEIRPLWLGASGRKISLDLMSKHDFAAWLIAGLNVWDERG